MIHPQHVLLDLAIELTHLDLYLNIVESEIILSLVTFHYVHIDFITKNGGYGWEAEFKNIEIFDLTNYPRTVTSHIIQPYKLFSVRESSDSLFKMKVFIYSKDNPEKPDELGTIVNMEMSSVRIVYLHQPMMRTIDFFNYKILGLFDSESRMRDTNYWSPLYKLSYLLNSSAFETLNHEGIVNEERSFTSISVGISNPLLIFIPRPYYKEYFTADLGNISITNRASSTAKRHSTQTIWLDIFTINMENINISSTDREIIGDFQLLLELERPVLSQARGEAPLIDCSYTISGMIQKMNFNLSQRDLKLLFNLVDLNISYDGQLDSKFHPNISQIQPSNDPTHGGIFISLALDIESISVLLMCSSESVAELFFGDSSLCLTKYNDYAMDLKFLSLTLLGLVNEETVGITDCSVLFQEMWTPPEETRPNYIDVKRLPHILFGPLSAPVNSPSFSVDFISSWDGNKDFLIEFSQFR